MSRATVATWWGVDDDGLSQRTGVPRGTSRDAIDAQTVLKSINSYNNHSYIPYPPCRRDLPAFTRGADFPPDAFFGA